MENVQAQANSNTGVLYITENENMFFAPEGISNEEYERISLEIDINAMKDKIKELEAKQKDISNEEPLYQELPSSNPVEIDKNSKEYKKFVYETGEHALSNQAIIDQMMNDPKQEKLRRTFNHYIRNQNDRKALDHLRFTLGQYVVDSNPEMVADFNRNSVQPPKISEFHEPEANSIPVAAKEILPPFTVQTKDGLKHFENMRISSFDERTGLYLLDNGDEQLKIPARTLQELTHNEEKKVTSEKEKKTFEVEQDSPIAVMGSTVVPEFAMITSSGIQTFKDLKVRSYDPESQSYTLGNENTNLTVAKDTFSQIMKPERFNRTWDEKTPEYEKLIESQYNDFFRQRDNTANNFRHNLSVYCRKEANSPLDALKIAEDLVSRMSREEQRKTRLILQQIAKEDETINHVLVRTYYEAINGIPLDRDKILHDKEKERIVKASQDRIDTKGQKIDPDSELKIGDTIKNMAFNVPKPFGLGKEKLYQDLTVVSSSKEGNIITLMDKNRSFYEVPRDTLLEKYNRQQEKQQKKEQRERKANRIDMSWGR